MLKRRRKFELALKDQHGLIANPEAPDRRSQLYRSALRFNPFIEEISCDPRKARAMIHATGLLRDGIGPGQQIGEEKMMDCLFSIASGCSDQMEEAGLPVCASPKREQIPEEHLKRWTVLCLVCDYAMSCFKFKRVRDSFGKRRRAVAFEILGQASGYIDLSEAVAIAEDLADTDQPEAWAAGEFLDLYDRVVSD